MKYIAQYENTLLGDEYFTLSKGFFRSFHNPAFASVFDTKKQCREFIRENNGTGCKLEPVELDVAVKKFEALSKKGFPMRKFKARNKEISRCYNNESPDEVLAWHLSYMKADESEVLYEDYATWPNLWEVFECINTIDKYDKDITFSMRVEPNTEFSVFKKELEKILPHVTYTDNGYKCIEIFDHHLNEGGNSAYFLAKNGKYAIEESFGRRFSGTLKEVFDYWKRERWYV